MPNYRSSVTVAAQPAAIWPLLSTVVAWPEWLPTVTEVQALDEPALCPGARYRVVQPRLRPTVWTVTEVQAQRQFRWESSSPGVRVMADHRLVPLSPASTRVDLTIQFEGPLAWLAALAAGRLTRSYLKQEAAALQRRVAQVASD